ncbi:MAG: nucleotidyltransferase domain-containing protein [Pirellulales bacterium]|nr:nucleotidyltransferase domain-containing protein [Pirellulales bacterium]
MRKSSAIDPLLTRPLQELLTVFLLEGNSWYLSDLAQRLRRRPSTLQRPLAALTRAGILQRWSDGNRVYYASDPDCPFLAELRGLLEKTSGLADVLRMALRPWARRIQWALVYGSMARGEEHSRSDVDLLIVGDVTLAELVPVLGKMELRLRRPINAIIHGRDEFQKKIVQKKHFLHSLLSRDKIWLIGNPDELEHLIDRR